MSERFSEKEIYQINQAVLITYGAQLHVQPIKCVDVVGDSINLHRVLKYEVLCSICRNHFMQEPSGEIQDLIKGCLNTVEGSNDANDVRGLLVVCGYAGVEMPLWVVRYAEELRKQKVIDLSAISKEDYDIGSITVIESEIGHTPIWYSDLDPLSCFA